MRRRAASRRAATGDAGSVLPLVIGAVVIVTALIGVVTDASALWLARRSLQSVVDGGALAGAQALDLDAVYADGVDGDLPIDAPQARAAVRAWTRDSPAAHDLPAFRLVSTRVSATTVTVRAHATVRLPFTSFLTGAGVPVVAEAAASTAAR